jgi:hypothetical protein
MMSEYRVFRPKSRLSERREGNNKRIEKLINEKRKVN